MKNKIKFRALKDLCYMFGIWIVMRYSPVSAGELLERWGMALQRKNYQ